MQLGNTSTLSNSTVTTAETSIKSTTSAMLASGQLTNETSTWAGANATTYYYANGAVQRRTEGATVYDYALSL